jgi:signal transduction histidine kinase
MIRQVLENLIGNAAKYSDGPGRIVVDAVVGPESVAVRVADRGIGMTSQQASRIFDEFYKADTSRHDLASVGLGLSICRRIMELHGGSIRVESTTPGVGTVMRAELPAREVAGNRESDVECEAQAGPAGR